MKLAEVAADYLRQTNSREGMKYWSLDTGMEQELFEIYERWRKAEGRPRGGLQQHTSPMRRTFYPRYTVMRALVHSKTGIRLFESDQVINYPGIINKWCTVATLREEYRTGSQNGESREPAT